MCGEVTCFCLLCKQDRQHVASILGGLSMGVAACMCTCLACYRMAEGIDDDEGQGARSLRKMERRRYVVGAAFHS